MNCGVVLNVTILEIKIGESMESIEGRNVTDYGQLDNAIREVAKKYLSPNQRIEIEYLPKEN